MSWNHPPEWLEHIVQSLLAALRERDPYSYGHCVRVANLAAFLAKAAGMPAEEQLTIKYASLFHDLGKLGIPDSILHKPGKLSAQEEEVMRQHPAKSVEVLSPISRFPEIRSVLPGILHHHERVDGKGYPHGLIGEQVPLHSRLILIADTYDAMTSDRPYRKRLPSEVAYKELRIFSGRQFDSQLVETFIQAHPGMRPEEEQGEVIPLRKKPKKAA